MKISIIGAGNVGSALASRWKDKHEVVFGVRDPLSLKSEKASSLTGGVTMLSIEEAAKTASVIVITTPPEAILGLIPQIGELEGKVIIDSTNSIRNKPEPYSTAFEAIKKLSGAEEVVKCFNTTGFENMTNPYYQISHPVPHSIGIDMFMAGSSTKAKEVAKTLALEAGFSACYDFGGDDKVELLEKLALCWINLAIMQGYGRDFAFKLIKRD